MFLIHNAYFFTYYFFKYKQSAFIYYKYSPYMENIYKLTSLACDFCKQCIFWIYL